MKRLRKIFRRQRHLKFVESYLTDLQLDTLNTVIQAQVYCNWCDDIIDHLNSNANLIRKYQRRLKLLRF